MSILTLYKPKHIFQNLGKPTEIPNHFYNASFLFYTYININIRIVVEYYDHNQN